MAQGFSYSVIVISAKLLAVWSMISNNMRFSLKFRIKHNNKRQQQQSGLLSQKDMKPYGTSQGN